MDKAIDTGKAVIRVVFLIRKLDVGGAERQLLNLIRGLADDKRFEIYVVTLYSGGALEGEYSRQLGSRYISVDRKGRWDIGSLFRLHRIAGSAKPNIIHGYMSGANEIAEILGRLLGCKSVWGIRVSDQEFSNYSIFRRLVFQVGVFLARHANMIIANSIAGRSYHIAAGYPDSKFVVISNGIDVDLFRPDSESRDRWRLRNALSPNSIAIALPARIDPMKDHELFLRAAAKLPKTINGRDIRYFCIGRGNAPLENELKALGHTLGLGSRVVWLSPSDSPQDIYNGADLICSTSRFGEGFPNVVAEAMACARVCIATDCGDAAYLVGKCGFIVDKGNVEQYAGKILTALEMPTVDSLAMGAAARARIVEEFSIGALAQQTSSILQTVAAD